MNRDDQLSAIGERLRTQDNRITAEPMFCVQVKRRDHGYDPDYSDDFEWTDDEGAKCSPSDLHAEKRYYKERWETVMVAFTEGGCEEYLRLNGHNHTGEKRIYVESFRRCPEMIAIRAWLMRNPTEQEAETAAV